MIENKCVNTLEPEATLAEMNKQGYRLVTAISKFQGVLLFFERVNETTITQRLPAIDDTSAKKLADTVKELTQPQPAKGKRK